MNETAVPSNEAGQTADQINRPQIGHSESLPPVARTAVSGQRTEQEVDLRKELATAKETVTTTAAEKKKLEIRIAELERQLQELRAIQSGPSNTPAKKFGGWHPIISDEAD